MKTEHLQVELHSPSNSRPNLKVDLCFYNAVAHVRRSFTLSTVYHTIKCITLLLFTSIFYPSTHNHNLMVAFILATCLAFILSLLYITFLRRTSNPQVILEAGQQHGHVMVEQAVGGSIPSQLTLQSIRSSVYDFTVPPENEITLAQKQAYEKLIAASVVGSFYFTDCGKCILQLCNLLGIALLIYFIVEMASNKQIQTGALTMGIIYVVFEALSKIEFILLALLCALLPLAFVVCCLCMCCCGNRRPGEGSMPEIPAVKYTLGMALQTDPECRICFQNFKVDEQLLILPCDNRHVFHKFCADQWFRVSSSCPLCRKNLAE